MIRRTSWLRSPRRLRKQAAGHGNDRRLLLERLEDRSLLAGFNFADFSASGTLSLVGDAAITADNRLRLTPAEGGRAGAAWYTAEKEFVGAAFSTTFQFQLANNFDSPGGSDGFVFIIQNSAPTYLSGGGGTLGYYGLQNSLAVEFDTFQNSEVADPSGSHISVHTNGTGPNDWSESLSLGSYNTNPIMDDANVHTAKIAYTAGTLSIYLDDLTTPKLTISVDLADKLSLDAGRAWVGFTATTGGGWQTHDILNWNLDTTIPATTVGINNVSVIEGDSGASSLVFAVTRSGDLSAASIVDWTTVDGSATAASGDYVAAAGQVTFAAGETEQTIIITANGDTTLEAHETFTVKLVSATNAWILDSLGGGTILNDETSIAISDTTATEGDTSFRFVDRFVGATAAAPRGVAFGPDGNLYIGALGFGGVVRYDGQTGQFLDVFADGSSVANQASQVVFQGKYLFVATGTSGILRFNASTGEAAPAFNKPGAQFATPEDQGVVQGVHGVAFGPDGHLYLTSNVSNQVLKYDGATGEFLGVFVPAGSGGLAQANALVFGADGALYVGSSANSAVLRYRGPLQPNAGSFQDTFVPSGSGGLSGIAGLKFGPDGDLYVSSRNTSSVLRFDGVSGAFREEVAAPGEGGLSTTGGFAFDNAGHIYVASQNTNEILRYGRGTEEFFTVSLAVPSALPVSVNYTTQPGTATAGSDYTTISSTVAFAPGQTTRTIFVQILDDSGVESNETFFVNLSGPVGGMITDSQGVGTIIDNDIPPTKFYVVDDATTNKTYEYGASGLAVENYAINSGNSAPRGAASTTAGDKVWVIDANKIVYVYNTSGGLLGSWTAGSVNPSAQLEGIATNGTDIWIVDAKQDKVFKYTGAASRLSGSQNAASSFSLNSGNSDPKDLVTDGTSIWVVNDSFTDKVFKYNASSGALLGSWTISTAGVSAPTGITLDPSSPSQLWIVDNSTDRVYQYDAAVGRTSGSQSASTSFALAAGNSNPQGIADPPVGDATPVAVGVDSPRSVAAAPMLAGIQTSAEMGRVSTQSDEGVEQERMDLYLGDLQMDAALLQFEVAGRSGNSVAAPDSSSIHDEALSDIAAELDRLAPLTGRRVQTLR